MDVASVVLSVLYLLGCLVVAFFGLLVMGLGENRTPAEQDEAERAGLAMLAELLLAIAIVILLGLRLPTLAAVAYGVQLLLGVFILVYVLGEGDAILWPLLFAFGLAGTGLGLLWATASMRARRRGFA
jgi:hypothetical protein